MSQKNIYILLLTLFLFSCVVPKDSRRLKRATKDWRKAEKTFWAYYDSPLGSTTLILRNNNKFELIAGGVYLTWFYAGSWTYQQDTLKLSYVDSYKTVSSTQNAYLNKPKNQLYLLDSDTITTTLRVLLNNIGK